MEIRCRIESTRYGEKHRGKGKRLCELAERPALLGLGYGMPPNVIRVIYTGRFRLTEVLKYTIRYIFMPDRRTGMEPDT